MKTMLEYYNDNIPYNQRWSKIDCRKEYFEAMCDLCHLIDMSIPNLISQQEIGATAIAISSILYGIKYKINETFITDFTNIITETMLTWQSGWTNSVTIATAAQSYPLGVLPPSYVLPDIYVLNPSIPSYTSMIASRFDKLSYTTYNNSESIRVFGTSLNEYVTDLMKDNLIYRINRP